MTTPINWTTARVALSDLVRLLARQAARELIEAEGENPPPSPLEQPK
jgi:hypothetical protein